MVTLLDGDPVGVIPQGGTLQDAFNDARVLKNDRNRVGHLLEKESRFCVILAYYIYPLSRIVALKLSTNLATATSSALNPSVVS